MLIVANGAARKGAALLRPCTHKSRLVSSGWSLSALPPKADIRQGIEHVCFVPLTDIGSEDHRLHQILNTVARGAETGREGSTAPCILSLLML